MHSKSRGNLKWNIFRVLLVSKYAFRVISLLVSETNIFFFSASIVVSILCHIWDQNSISCFEWKFNLTKLFKISCCFHFTLKQSEIKPWLELSILSTMQDTISSWWYDNFTTMCFTVYFVLPFTSHPRSQNYQITILHVTHINMHSICHMVELDRINYVQLCV